MSGPRDKGLAVPSSRLARLTRLGAMTAGVAGNMALGGAAQFGRGQRPDWRALMLTPKNAMRVADQLANMRGAAMKIGQLMSMDTGDILPPELAQIMSRLRDDAQFMPPAQLKKVLNNAWGDGWLKSFERFDVRPIAAASIGQVHRAKLRDGRVLAIKVQYPGVARSIDSDVANVGVLIKMSGLLPKGFEIDRYLQEAALQLHEETDYLREAKWLKEFRCLLADNDSFVVPRVHEDWSTGRVLAMDFVAGSPIEDAEKEDQSRRDAIMYQVLDLCLRELFLFKALQSDPNFSNYRYDPENRAVILLDFGATLKVSSYISDAYRDILRFGLATDEVKLEESLISAGFLNKNMNIPHRKMVLAIVCEVFDWLRAPMVDFSDLTLTRRVQSVAEELARDGFIPPELPMEMLYIQRKLGGMFLLGARLRAKLPVAEMLAPYLRD